MKHQILCSILTCLTAAYLTGCAAAKQPETSVPEPGTQTETTTQTTEASSAEATSDAVTETQRETTSAETTAVTMTEAQTEAPITEPTAGIVTEAQTEAPVTEAAPETIAEASVQPLVYNDYFGSILQNSTIDVPLPDFGAVYSADLSWYDLADIDSDNEKELIAEYDIPSGGENGRFLVIYNVEGSIVASSEPISVFHSNSFYVAADGNGLIYVGYATGGYWFGRIAPPAYQCETIDNWIEGDEHQADYEQELNRHTGTLLTMHNASDLTPLLEQAPDSFERW